MRIWKEAVSRTYDRTYWFRNGDKPTWHNPTQLKGTIDRLNSEQIVDLASLRKASEDLKVFLPDGVDTIVDWLFSQTVMTSEFLTTLSELLCTGNATFHDGLQQRCRSAIELELEEDKDDYPFLRYFGYLKLKSFEQDYQDTLNKLTAPFLSEGIENAPLSLALRRLKAFSTAGCRGAVELKSLVTILLQSSTMSVKDREILVDVGYMLSKRADPPQTFRALETSKSVNKDLEWLMSAEESPCLSHGSVHTVVVLLGAPMAGKSFLGRYFQSAGCSFLDVGQQLRDLGLLQKSQSMFTEASGQNRRAIAIHLLDEALRSYMQSVATHPMVVTFVKSVEDSYILLDRISRAAESAGVRFRIQALHLWDSDYLNCVGMMTERKRELKWDANKVGIFEVFASQHCLFEFTSYAETKNYCNYVKWKYNRKVPAFTAYPLVTGMNERSAIIAQVQRLLGVETIEFMQPSSFVRSEQQCRWISFPGSYQVSYKVRGTRYWLIVLQQGSSCWLLNRLGSIYKIDRVEFCMSNSSDKGFFEGLVDTVFDGMLLTESCAGHQFVVFDVLCFNGRSTWPLSLDGRLSKCAALSPFTAVMATTVSTNTCIYVQRNISQPISTDNIAALLAAKGKAALFGSVDGLIFSPTTSYTFGSSILTFKWQDLQDFKVDITQERSVVDTTTWQQPIRKKRLTDGDTIDVSSAESANSRTLDIVGRRYCTGYVYKCVWRNSSWTIDSLRVDKNQLRESVCKEFLSIKAAVELGDPLWDSQMLLSAFRSHELLRIDSAIGSAASTVSGVVASSVDAVAMEMESSLQLANESGAESADQKSSNESKLHPARSLPFDELYAMACAYVQGKKIERSIDAATGLEIYSYLVLESTAADNDASESMKRHRARIRSKVRSYYDNDIELTNSEDLEKIVDTLAFESNKFVGCIEKSCGCCDGLAHCRHCWVLIGAGFTECYYCLRNQSERYSSLTKTQDPSSEDSEDPTLSMFRGLILHPESKTVVATPFVRFFRSKMFDLNSRANRVVRASVKYDGSLIIAFRWKGDLLTSTRRRMSSEQAVVARAILQQSAPVQREFREGWTYLLELVGGSNVHISQYATTQCLVLLSVFDSDGIEVDISERVSIAERAGLLFPPTIYGYIKDIADIAQGQGIIVGEASANSEGWVVEDPMDGARFKLINSSWDKTSIAVKSLVHPCVVWRSLLMCSFQSLQSHPYLPPHARKEMNLMADAIINNAMGPIRNLIYKHSTKCSHGSVYDKWPRGSASSELAVPFLNSKPEINDVLDKNSVNDIALTNCEDYYNITRALSEESARCSGCDGRRCGSCDGLAHCQKCWILIAAGYTECYYCLHKGLSSFPLRLRDQPMTSSKVLVSQVSMMKAVKIKDPIATVSLLSSADYMGVAMDVEDILARSTTPSQWDCSSMFPSEEGRYVYNSVSARATITLYLHYYRNRFLCIHL